MANRKRKPLAPQERKNRVMLSFSDEDYKTLEEKAAEAGLAIATYARLVVLGKTPAVSSKAY